MWDDPYHTTGQSESVSERESMGKNILQDLKLRLLLRERTMLLFECPFWTEKSNVGRSLSYDRPK